MSSTATGARRRAAELGSEDDVEIAAQQRRRRRRHPRGAQERYALGGVAIPTGPSRAITVRVDQLGVARRRAQRLGRLSHPGARQHRRVARGAATRPCGRARRGGPARCSAPSIDRAGWPSRAGRRLVPAAAEVEERGGWRGRRTRSTRNTASDRAGSGSRAGSHSHRACQAAAHRSRPGPCSDRLVLIRAARPRPVGELVVVHRGDDRMGQRGGRCTSGSRWYWA